MAAFEWRARWPVFFGASDHEMLSVVDGSVDERDVGGILRSVSVGDIVSGTIVEVTSSHGAVVQLDVGLAAALATIGPAELSWRQRPAEAARVGHHITAEVIAVDLEESRIRLSLAATENPELWAFLKALHPGEALSGVVAAVRPFGVFVALDDGPPHPVYPGVGFITVPELSWRRIETLSEVVEVGQHVTCAVLYFDTWNGEARLSLRALEPDPFQEFADSAREGDAVRGTVTKLAPFGAFVRVADGVEGLVHLSELALEPIEAPEQVVQVGDRISVVITRLERDRRRLSLSLKRAESRRIPH